MLTYGYAIAPLSRVSENSPFGAVIGFTFPLLALVLTALMFATARRGNGYAGLHDLATCTRVVPDPITSQRGWLIPAAASVLLFLIGALYAARHPERGLQDRIAGTWLVPR